MQQQETAQYIHALAKELSVIAAAANLRLLAYLLAMAAEQALVDAREASGPDAREAA